MADSELLTKLTDSIDTPELTPQFRNEIILLRAFWLKAENDINNLLSKPEIKEQIQADLIPVFEQITANVNYLFYLLSADGTGGYIVNQDNELLESINYLGSELSKLTVDHGLLINDTQQALETEKIRNDLQDSRLDRLFSVDGTSGIVKNIIDIIDALTGLDLENLRADFNKDINDILDELVTINGGITSVHQEINTLKSGDIITLKSSITQLIDAINLSVSRSEYNDQNKTILDLSSSLDIQAGSINSVVNKLLYLIGPDGTKGIIEELRTNITQTEAKIELEALHRQTLENGSILQNTSSITQTAEAVSSLVTQSDSLTSRVNTAEETLTSLGKTIRALTTNFNGAYSIETIMALTSNGFGIDLHETSYGQEYAAGFTLLMHPTWLASNGEDIINYAVGDKVSYGDSIYICIMAHESTEDTGPGSTNSSTYWEDSESNKTEFVVAADTFKVISPNDETLKTPFIIDTTGATDTVGINGDMLVDGTVKAKALKADDIYTMSITIGNNSSGYDNLIDAPHHISDTLLLNWEAASVEDEKIISVEGEIWEFDSDFTDGALVMVEVDDAYAGSLQVSLNDQNLSLDAPPIDLDCGQMNETAYFENESPIQALNDLSTTNDNLDLGGL